MTPEEIEEEIQASNLRHRIADDRMNNMETLITKNTELTQKTVDSIAEIKEILELGKTFFKLMTYLGIFLKWVSAVAAGLAVLWALWTKR